MFDEGSYTCSIQTKQQAKTSQVYLIVQGKKQPAAHCLFMRVSPLMNTLKRNNEKHWITLLVCVVVNIPLTKLLYLIIINSIAVNYEKAR